jgi:hypothetical protein
MSQAMTRTLTVAMIAAAAAAAGCGGAQKRGDELMASVTTYNDGVRWGRFAAAAAVVPPAEREDFVDERDDLEDDLRISDWQLVKVKAVGERRARVQIEYTWFLDSVGTVHETQAEQRWELHGKAWLMVDERYKKGEPMPGLADPPSEPEADPAAAAEGSDTGGEGGDGAAGARGGDGAHPPTASR